MKNNNGVPKSTPFLSPSKQKPPYLILLFINLTIFSSVFLSP